MDRDIYNMLNDADFSNEEVVLNNGEDATIDEVERKRIKNSIDKSMNGKKMSNKKKSRKVKIAGVVVAAVCIIVISNANIRNVVWASVTEIASKFDISKNSANDFVVELNQEYTHNGVTLKLEEAYRDSREIRIVYSMNFKNGVPESVKAIEIPSNGDNVLVGEDMPKKQYKLYENSGIRGCNIYIDGVDINSSVSKGSDILSVVSKELSIEENKIQKELVISLMNSDVKDVNICIDYESIIENNGNILNGPWKIDYKVTSNVIGDEIKKTPIEGDYKFTGRNGEITDIESYAYTNTGLKIYGTNYNLQEYTGEVSEESWSHTRLQGTDNLGNKIIMYPRYPNYTEEFEAARKAKTEYNLYDGPEGVFNDRPTFAEGVTSVTLRIYEERLTLFDDGNYNLTWEPVGKEFTINLE